MELEDRTLPGRFRRSVVDVHHPPLRTVNNQRTAASPHEWLLLHYFGALYHLVTDLDPHGFSKLGTSLTPRFLGAVRGKLARRASEAGG